MPLRRSVSVKFAAAVGVVVLGVVCVALIGANGLVQLRSDIERLTLDDLSDVRAVDDLAIGVYSAREAALAELAAPAGEAAASQVLDQSVLPRMTEELEAVR